MILFPSSTAYLQRNEHYYARSCLARIMRIEKVTKLTMYSFVLYNIILYDFMFYHQANSRCKNFAKNIAGITYSSYNVKEILKCLPWWWKTTASTFQTSMEHWTQHTMARLPNTICLDINVDYDSSFRIIMLDLPSTSKTKEFFFKTTVIIWSPDVSFKIQLIS